MKQPKLSSRTHGPISNLEDYVDSNWWTELFNEYYLKTDGDVVDDIQITRAEVDEFIQIMRLAKEERILDLCCGQGRHTLEFARRGFHRVEGYDYSRYLIKVARKQSKRSGLHVPFDQGDARSLPYETSSFHKVLILGNSFGYFQNINDDLIVLQEAFRVLKGGGSILIDITDGEFIKHNFEKRSWEWIDKDYFVCRERSLSADEQSLISREIVNHAKKGILVDQFYTERLYTKDALKDLLEKAGFMNVVFNKALESTSQRNQDLGMMSRRILVSASVRKVEHAIVPSPRKALNVYVLLGDKTRPDEVKPGGVFDEDDIYTINQLKIALSELEKTGYYRFQYLDNHSLFLSGIEKIAKKKEADLIFNLCDEGYDNDPKRELHIPALLDMLYLPYTGSDPRCLAFCYDKSLVRGIAEELNVPVAKGIVVSPGETNIKWKNSFPAIVKPNIGDGSFGITVKSIVNSNEELNAAIEELRIKFGTHRYILVEQFLNGKEITVGLIGNPHKTYRFFTITEEDFSVLPPDLPHLCGYEAKWLPESPYWKLRSIPANLPQETENFVKQCCLTLMHRLDVLDYARFDWRLDEKGNPYLLEVNPNPGWCWDGHLMKMAALDGLTYPEMLGLILQSAVERHFS